MCAPSAIAAITAGRLTVFRSDSSASASAPCNVMGCFPSSFLAWVLGAMQFRQAVYGQLVRLLQCPSTAASAPGWSWNSSPCAAARYDGWTPNRDRLTPSVVLMIRVNSLFLIMSTECGRPSLDLVPPAADAGLGDRAAGAAGRRDLKAQFCQLACDAYRTAGRLHVLKATPSHPAAGALPPSIDLANASPVRPTPMTSGGLHFRTQQGIPRRGTSRTGTPPLSRSSAWDDLAVDTLFTQGPARPCSAPQSWPGTSRRLDTKARYARRGD